MEDSEFVRTVLGEVTEIKDAYGLNNLGNAFSLWFAINVLGEDEDKSAEEYFIGCSRDEKLDLGICDEDHDLIFLVQCKYSEDGEKQHYNKDIVDEIIAAERRLIDSPSTGNDKRKAFAQIFNPMVKNKEKPVLKIAAIFGDLSDSSGVQAYANNTGVEIYDFNRIKDMCTYLRGAAPSKRPETMSLGVPSGKFIKMQTPTYELYSFLCPIKYVYYAVKEYKDGIFEENLRYRLVEKTKSKIGQEIKKTILVNPEKLAVMNNGITITCVRMDDLKDGIFTPVNPQIVNGCQTSWAIYDVGKDLERDKLMEEYPAVVPVRVIKSMDPDLVKDITLATNNQNPIGERDLHSKDQIQKDIHSAFNDFNPKILYLYREGQLDQVGRENKLHNYRIRGKNYRTIENTHAGQIYLALMGKPNLSRNEKRKIFSSPSYYNSIFNYQLPMDARFNNADLAITPQNIFMKSGKMGYFIDDTLFGFALFKLSSAFSHMYKKKLDLYEEGERPSDSTYNILINQMDFLTKWQYYHVAAIYHIVHTIARGDTDQSKLKEALVGTDIDAWWAKKAYESFTINADKTRPIILDENAPSTKYKLFSLWSATLTELMREMVKNDTDQNKWKSSRSFLDLQTDTYGRFLSKINDILNKPAHMRNVYFPITPP